MGVAKVDVSKRVDVRSPVVRAIDELLKREREIALALLAPAERDAFEFGRICGLAQENKHSVSILEHCLNEGDPESAERHGES